MSGRGRIQLIIPMAGLGTRFTDAGYTTSKPLLPVHGQAMYRTVLANLLTEDVASVTLVAQKAFDLGQDVEALRSHTSAEVRLIEIDYITSGPAETVELALNHLKLEDPIVTANSDQYVNCSLIAMYQQLYFEDVVGNILVMEDSDPKWSYVKLKENGDVGQVREKQVISNLATVGIYGFESGNALKKAFNLMREAQDTVNGEFYVAPAYNQLIARGSRIVAHNVGPVSTVMHGLGTPEDYEAFLRHPDSFKIARRASTLFDVSGG